MFVLCLVIILTATVLSLANSDSINHLELQGINALSYPLSDGTIFHKDKHNRLLIDFKAVKAKLVQVQIAKNNNVLLSDPVSDLSTNIIYEVDLNKYGKGTYTVTLTTSQQKVITETISVQ